MNYKTIRAAVNTCPLTFQRSQYYGKMPLRVSKSKFSADNLKNLRCIIRRLSLLRYNANLSKLEVRNLYESIKRNFILFFFCSSSVLLTFLMRYIFLSLSEVARHVHRTLWLFP